jgi:hypothetical protein
MANRSGTSKYGLFRTVGAFLILIPVGLGISAGTPAPQGPDWPRTILFDSAEARVETAIALSEVAPDFPRDWSGFEALVLEIRASSPQRFNLKIYRRTDNPARREFSRVLFHPYPNVWLRAAVPVALLSEPPATGHDMAAVGNRSRPGYYLGLWGPFVPLDDVEAVAFEMVDPVGSPTLEIRSIRLARTSPGDAVLEGAPVVDEFGQFAHATWPGKAESLGRLEEDWRAEESSLEAGDFGYCQYGGYAGTQAEATGFFRVEKIDGKWWFIDPDGHLFLSVGADVIRPEMLTRTVGRETLFARMPPASTSPSVRREGDPGASFLTWNIQRRFGADWVEPWLELTLRRLDAWGLNTVANWSDSRLWDTGRKPYVIALASWQTDVNYLGLPDVYSEEFVRLADERAERQCAPRKNDPWLLGYFLANEPPFPQKELQTAGMILAGPDTATKAEFERWLAEGDTEERRKQFIGRAFHRYVEVTSEAVRRHDPNHLNLGMRGGGRPTADEIEAARFFDVYSVNVYDHQVAPERVREISELTGKPMLIGEFHFGTPGRGLSAGLVQVRDYAERGTGYRYYVEQAFAMPEMIGAHWFQWADQLCTGRFDGENYNIGLVDVTDRPYGDLVEALKTTHKRLYRIHTGELEPFATRAAPR